MLVTMVSKLLYDLFRGRTTCFYRGSIHLYAKYQQDITVTLLPPKDSGFCDVWTIIPLTSCGITMASTSGNSTKLFSIMRNTIYCNDSTGVTKCLDWKELCWEISVPYWESLLLVVNSNVKIVAPPILGRWHSWLICLHKHHLEYVSNMSLAECPRGLFQKARTETNNRLPADGCPHDGCNQYFGRLLMQSEIYSRCSRYGLFT